ncbi:MAG TPA: beta-galactosidase [Planctomycetota bacterium]|nr:beta-galactosidase [Planctomycetota bacterium]
MTPCSRVVTRIILLFLFVAANSLFSGEAGAEAVPLPDDKPPVKAEPEKQPAPKLDAPKRVRKSDRNPPKIEAEPAPPSPAPQPEPVSPAPTPVTVTPETDPLKPVVPTDPGAELVPLPAERPATAATANKEKTIIAEKIDADATLALSLETPQVKPGDTAIFSLYGPELFLREATARFVLRDEFAREIARGEKKVIEIPYSEDKPRQLAFPLKNPLSQQHELQLTLSGADGKEFNLRAAFSVPQPKPWENWITLVATPPLAADAENGWAALRKLGISGGMQYRIHPARREALRKGHAAFYVENIARQLLSRYHTEAGLWGKTIELISQEPGSHTVLSRVPSLSNPQFAELFAKELKRHAEVYAKDPPLFYSLASEPSVTRLAAAADFDFHPAAITEFQRWLERDVYGTLKALNTSWGTDFKAWSDVLPMSTDDARLRLNDGVMNAAPWVDFREFQDYSFSKILKDGADYIRRYDPNAKVGITGAMGPFAFGGWDWSKLARSLDVVECYDIGGARALWRDLAPGKPAIAVIPLVENPEAKPGELAADATRAMWSLALEGGPRGVVLWDDLPGENGSARSLLDESGRPTALAEALRPALNALNGESGALLANCERLHDGVAILYSPASIRMQWLLEANRLHGDKWLEAWGADTSGERRQSPQLKLRESWGKLLDDIGLGWRFISSAQIESKEILRPELRIKTLVLPQAIALSDREAEVLKEFTAAGGKVIADAACGRFDEHGKMRARPALDALLEIDTSAEPLSPQKMNPLEAITISGNAAGAITRENVEHLAPVFSDKPKRTGQSQGTLLEYRRSPVLAVNKAGAYVNLDLTDYLHWRLHPDEPRAKAVREILAQALFADRLSECLIDWKKSQMPLGVQAVWLQLRGAGSSARVLALRRNLQERLHELGNESDGNWPFEKSEAFTLQLRAPATVLNLATGVGGPAPVLKIEGRIHPAAPSLFVLNTQPAQPPKLVAPRNARVGEVLTGEIQTPQRHAALFAIRLFAPDGSERGYHAITRFCADGVLSLQIPLALSEPPGTWKIIVRDLGQGTEASATVEIAK